jgi:outer membrane protein OmpA-like peptidoglycan-associated protein
MSHAECLLRMLRGVDPFNTTTPVLYFGSNQATLGAEAKAMLDDLAAAYVQSGENAPQIAISGYADTSGSAAYNSILSQRRANAVRDYLIGRGVPSAGLTTQAFGENRPAVETPEGVPDPTSRRVELSIGAEPW